VLLLGCQALAGILLVYDGGRVKDLGWTQVQRDEVRRVLAVTRGGPAEGRLTPGETIQAINGDTRLARVFSLHLFPLKPGAGYTLRVVNGTTRREVSLRVGVRRDPNVLLGQLASLSVSIAFALAGLIVALAPSGDRAEPIFERFAFASGLVLLGPALPSFDLLSRPAYAFAILTTSLNPLHLALGYQFAYRLSAGARDGRAWSLLSMLLYALASALCLLNLVQRTTFLFDPTLVVAFADQHAWLWDARTWITRQFTPFALAAVLAVTLRNGRAARDDSDRRRSRLLLLGWLGACLSAWLGPLGTLLSISVPVAAVGALRGRKGFDTPGRGPKTTQA
jgi:hypothetical protein